MPEAGRAPQEHGLATVGGARQFYSVHGGTAFTGGAEPLEGSRSSRGGRLSSLKPSSTAINLSDMMPPNLSVHNGGPRCARTAPAVGVHCFACSRSLVAPAARLKRACMTPLRLGSRHGTPVW